MLKATDETCRVPWVQMIAATMTALIPLTKQNLILLAGVMQLPRSSSPAMPARVETAHGHNPRGVAGRRRNVAGQLGARAHFELPQLSCRPTSGSSTVLDPTSQVVVALLSDLLLGTTTELLVKQRLAWASAIIPDVLLPARLPLTVATKVVGLIPRCASRPVLARERKSKRCSYTATAILSRH